MPHPGRTSPQALSLQQGAPPFWREKGEGSWERLESGSPEPATQDLEQRLPSSLQPLVLIDAEDQRWG